MEPAWHDVPPVPGYYQWIGWNGVAGASLIEHPKSWTGPAWDGWHFYGPLPDPPPIPEPPKPPRFFTAKCQGVERYGVVLPDGAVRVINSLGTNTGTANEENMRLFYTDIRWYAPEKSDGE